MLPSFDRGKANNSCFLVSMGAWASCEHARHDARRPLKKIRTLIYKSPGCPEPRVIIRGLYDVFCLFENMEDPERPGHPVFVNNAREIMTKEVKYVQLGLLSDLPGMVMYRVVGKLSTGFEVHRGRRNSSALEGHHLHYRQSQHPAAKASGPITTAGRTLLFDLNWNVRAGVAAGLVPDVGHSHIWFVDALLDVVNVNKLGDDCVPPLFRSWRRTETMSDPMLKWGVQFEALGLGGQGALPSPIHKEADIAKVLESRASAELVAQRNVAALEHATGVATEPRHIDSLVDRTCKRHRASNTLSQHGADDVWARLRDGASDPASKPLRSVLPQLHLGQVGPTPMSAWVGRLAPSAANSTIVVAPMEFDALPIVLMTDDDDGGGDAPIPQPVLALAPPPAPAGATMAGSQLITNQGGTQAVIHARTKDRNARRNAAKRAKRAAANASH
jgi:hypothetical protein